MNVIATATASECDSDGDGDGDGSIDINITNCMNFAEIPMMRMDASCLRATSHPF